MNYYYYFFQDKDVFCSLLSHKEGKHLAEFEMPVVMKNPVIARIAAKHSATPAQVKECEVEHTV